MCLIMSNEILTKKLLEEILDDKLSPLKIQIESMSRTMSDFREFVDECNRKYEEVSQRMAQIQESNQAIQIENKALRSTILQLERNLRDVEGKYNDLEQYSRRECLEIHGIPPPDGNEEENINCIVSKIGELVGVKIDEDDISISHRLPTSAKYKGKRAIPAIIAKFVRRDLKESLYRARKELKQFTTSDIGYFAENKIFINESLTEPNKALYRNCLKVKREKDFNFIWTTNGKIYMRKDRDSRVIHIRNTCDLAKLQS